MNFSLSEDHKAVKEAAKNVAQLHLKNGVIKRDIDMEYPVKEVQKLKDLGFMGIMSDPKYGGSGMDTISYVLALEEISKIDASCAVIMSANNSLVAWGLEVYGTEEHKNKYLKPVAKGEKIGCFCLSEPEAGSDASSQQTTALDCGNHYILNGIKNWITSGGTSKIHLVVAQTDKEKGHRGIDVFIVESHWEGVKIGPKEDKLGIRSSDTHSIMYNNVKIPKENRLGPKGFGFKFAMKTLEGGRIGVAAQALGIAAGAYELSVNYAKIRKTFGKQIIEHQAIAFKLADMAMDIESARMLVYRAAWLKDQGLPYGTASAIAKLKASEVAMKHTIEAVQIHGGNGYVKEYHVERLMRDAKITQIYEGTSEIQRVIISRVIEKGFLELPI